MRAAASQAVAVAEDDVDGTWPDPLRDTVAWFAGSEEGLGVADL